MNTAGLRTSPIFRDTRKKAILFLDTGQFFGPLMQVHGRVIRCLDQEQFDIYLLADPKSDSPDCLSDLPQLNIWLQSLTAATGRHTSSIHWVRRLTYELGVAARLVTSAVRIRKKQINLLHVGMTFRSLTFGVVLSLLSGAALVAHLHQSPSYNGWLKRLWFKACMAQTSAVIAVSGFIREELVVAGAKPEKVTAILNTTDLNRFHPTVNGSAIRSEYDIAPEDFLVVCLGRFFPGKGQGYLARAIKMVHPEAPNVKALLIGWDDAGHTPGGQSYREEVRSFAHQNNLTDIVIVDDARPEAPEIMAAADIVAIPSTDDPCPLTALEAMASGKPIVAFRSGGIPEELGTEGAALLVEPGDVTGLAQSILTLARDPEMRRELGLKARKRAETYFYESRLAEEVTEIYQRLVHQPSREQRA